MVSQRGGQNLRLIYHFNKGHKLQRSGKTKKIRIRLLGLINCEKVNMWGEIIEDEDYFSKICYADPCWYFLSSVIRVVFPSWYRRGQGNTFTKGNFALLLGRCRGGKSSFCTCYFPVSVSQLYQNNFHAKMPYFEVECSEPLQCINKL